VRDAAAGIGRPSFGKTFFGALIFERMEPGEAALERRFGRGIAARLERDLAELRPVVRAVIVGEIVPGLVSASADAAIRRFI
jgi:hypothetical protein